MKAKSTSFPEWAGGVWYDPALLPEIPTSYGPANEAGWALVNDLVARSWDVIAKKYDPKKDDFLFKRYCSITLSTRTNGRKSEWQWGLTSDDVRIVAIMPHPDWRFVYETRLKVDIVKSDPSAVAEFDKEIDFEFNS